MLHFKTFYMKRELIRELFEKFEQACYVLEGVECWSARELQEIFDYAEWRNFVKVIEKAMEACKHSGVGVLDHFVETNKMIELAKGAQRQVEDFALTRYECYLLDQNGEWALFGGNSTSVMKRKQYS